MFITVCVFVCVCVCVFVFTSVYGPLWVCIVLYQEGVCIMYDDRQWAFYSVCVRVHTVCVCMHACLNVCMCVCSCVCLLFVCARMSSVPKKGSILRGCLNEGLCQQLD